MVQRVSTVAFQGVEVLDIDVEVQISPGLPQFNIVGNNEPCMDVQMKMVKRVGLTFYLFFLLMSVTHPVAGAQGATGHKCPVIGAEYVPQNQATQDAYDQGENLVNLTLSFILRIEKGDGSASPQRRHFLNFDAYDKGGTKVSTMRLADVSSMGVSRAAVSAYWGQYCDFDKEDSCKDFKDTSFYPIAIKKDFSPTSISEHADAPYMIIFPDTYWKLHNGSYDSPRQWDNYIKFYTKERIYPDFSFRDFWILKKCGMAS